MKGMEAEGMSSSSPEALASLVAWAGSDPNRWNQATGAVVQTQEGGRGIGQIVNAESTGSGFGVVVNYENLGPHCICPSAFGSVHSRAALPIRLVCEMAKAGFWVPSECERNEDHPRAPEDEHDERLGVAADMKKFSRKLLERSFQCLKEEAEARQTLCLCRGGVFEDGRKPDYSDRLMQHLYLVRYLPAYLCEYWLIYKRLLGKGVLTARMEILSIGCGCGLDLWGLHFALRYLGLASKVRLVYKGIDVVQWDGFSHLGHEASREQQRLCELETISPTTNVIMFPKSLSDVSAEEIEIFAKLLGQTPLTSDALVLVASMQHTDKMKQEERLMKVKDALMERRFYEQPGTCIEYGNTKKAGEGLEALCDGFDYPKDLHKKLKGLLNMCNKRQAIGERCEECEDPRNPIRNSRNMVFKALIFRRTPTRRAS